MDRRTLLQTVVASGVTLTAGCLGGKVVHEVRRQVNVQPGEYWMSRLPSVDGNGAISYSIRADQRFQLYVFTSESEVGAYQAYHANEEPDRAPSGHDRLSTIAGSGDEPGRYVAMTPENGAREPYEATRTWYFVVDHSSYGNGVEPGEHAGALNAFVDLQVIDEELGL